MASQFTSRAIPAQLAESDLFRRWDADTLKLYVWLRSRARRTSSSADRGPIEVRTTSAQIERAIGVSKNKVTRMVRQIVGLGVVTVEADHSGYRFRLGEWLHHEVSHLDRSTVVDALYLEAILDSEASDTRRAAGAQDQP